MNFIAGVMANGINEGTIYISFGFLIIFVGLLFLWFYRASRLAESFIKIAVETLGGEPCVKKRVPLFYKKEEVKAIYKGRLVYVGVIYSSFNREFLLLPHIQMRLKDSIGYNYERLPNYTLIKGNLLIYKIKMNIIWGVFDKNYPKVFTKSQLIIALDRLLSTAEDVERGRTVKDVFT